MVTPDNVRSYIAAGLPCDHLEVSGDGHHFEALIVAAAFEGKRPIQRHQLVYKALGDRMREEIHALSMRTLTPAEFAAQRPAGAADGEPAPADPSAGVRSIPIRGA